MLRKTSSKKSLLNREPNDNKNVGFLQHFHFCSLLRLRLWLWLRVFNCEHIINNKMFLKGMFKISLNKVSFLTKSSFYMFLIFSSSIFIWDLESSTASWQIHLEDKAKRTRNAVCKSLPSCASFKVYISKLDKSMF